MAVTVVLSHKKWREERREGKTRKLRDVGPRLLHLSIPFDPLSGGGERSTGKKKRTPLQHPLSLPTGLHFDERKGKDEKRKRKGRKKNYLHLA